MRLKCCHSDLRPSRSECLFAFPTKEDQKGNDNKKVGGGGGGVTAINSIVTTLNHVITAGQRFDPWSQAYTSGWPKSQASSLNAVSPFPNCSFENCLGMGSQL